MSKKLIVAGIIASGLYIISKVFRPKSRRGNDLDSEKGPPDHIADVKLIKGEWRVVLKGDESKSDIIANKKDIVRWRVYGSDVVFNFPDTRIFGFGDRKVKSGKFLTLPILADSPSGEFTYTVLIKKSGTYARGQSPPRIIVKE
jgi:hypothetical protein